MMLIMIHVVAHTWTKTYPKRKQRIGMILLARGKTFPKHSVFKQRIKHALKTSSPHTIPKNQTPEQKISMR